MSFIYEHEWLFFFLSEVLIWVLAVPFLILRYRYGLEQASIVLLIVILACNLFQGLLVVVDFVHTGEISFFQVVIVLFFIYAFTLGKSDFALMDQYLKKKFKPPHRVVKEASLLPYMRFRRKWMLGHTAAFLLLHSIWYAVDIGTLVPPAGLFFFQDWIRLPHQGYFEIPQLNALSYFWKVMYYVDLLFFLLLSTIWQATKPKTSV
ncbi:hypothetical protein DUZ99_12140 [Xylanibacillus composti]|uniref:Integral membrane protein n=1 Tax=Xylanibacillus composti TaxID=1572762 RepID=A0A8J4M4T8_9BACL|nr:hypothetical protein [Xylanibacillus composti]MDT9725724.1 hypothetical protein [Xylanibacillus composti]GIQ71136.1 hypothetical protein XYCOK13_39600 [Xylanibacillus composti]